MRDLRSNLRLFYFIPDYSIQNKYNVNDLYNFTFLADNKKQ